MENSEDKLKVGTEYYLDSQKINKGIFLNTDDTNVYFKRTSGFGYTENKGTISFTKENYNYKEVNAISNKNETPNFYYVFLIMVLFISLVFLSGAIVYYLIFRK